MKFTFKLFSISIILIFLAWIAKMHFIFGGDYLFRIGTIGVLASFMAQIIGLTKNVELKSHTLTSMFLVNSICLFIAYLGMMMKVSHIMNTQFEKDIVLDFLAIPAIVISAIYTFNNIHRLIGTTKTNKIIFYKQIVLPWTLFLASFLLYAVYSVILTTIK
jgi:hypothetical protein